MDGEAPAKPRGQVANQRAGWKMHLVLILCLLQAAHALQGPRLVCGEPGGAITIQCRYPPSSVNRHQRKYWCRLRSPTRLCHTVVSTNRYTHRGYGGRVALADFPHRGLFVVRLTRLAPQDAGSYRCGIGNRNDLLFLGMNLTISAGPASPSPSPGATPAASELVPGSFGTTSPAASRWALGTTRTIERQGTGWDRVALTPGSSKRTALAKGLQTPGASGTVTTRTVSWVDGSVWATVAAPESLASATRGKPDARERARLWLTRSSAAARVRASKEGGETTTEVDRPREEAERVRTASDADWTVIEAIRPSILASEKWAWGTHQEASLVSKPPALGSVEGTTRAAGAWAWGGPRIEVSSAEGSSEGDLDIPAGDSGPQRAPSQDPEAGPRRPPGQGSSMKSASPEEKNISRMLTPVSSVLCPLMLLALVLLQRKLQRKRTSQETDKAAGVTLIQMTHFLELSLQPDQLPHVERKILQDDSPPARGPTTIPERDPGP